MNYQLRKPKAEDAEALATIRVQAMKPSLVSYCESLSIFPQRGMKRDDVRAGLRITHYKKRAVIDFCGRCRVGIHLGHLLRRAAL